MITMYHRPRTIEEALTLLSQSDAVPLGGGTQLSQATSNPVQVVDLQALGLDYLKGNGTFLELGATLTLQNLLESDHCHPELKNALKLEAPLNIRNSATTAGSLIAADGRSSFTCAMLAMDAKITMKRNESSDDTINIGDFLPIRAGLHGKLITGFTIPSNIKFAFEVIARTPTDKPIVCAALVRWNSGRTRLALGGYGNIPLLAMDGTETDDLETAARNAYHEATDEWATAEYRMHVAAVLARRCLNRVMK